ncbi:interleukin 12 receptor, beta 2a, like isoform X1 [Etheostoma spectabile]|uniref:interleukin 12 receptor, beta 2a, like isoform X1 n=1 Tax=Etheostoma spectabile TaxID=54343 RepID=UPI0013AF5E9C|nr:interleukin-6 receptor subunit beta-like isoform X1 [Etheostoma spectabile]
MAKFRTRWRLSILLVLLPNCLAPGPPAAPSLPDCSIPCDEINNCADIHCSWDARPDPQITTNYSLHWKTADREEGHVITGPSFSGIIQREHFSHGELCVWVQAKNQHGSAKSQEAVFDTANIMKPPPPTVRLSHKDSLEIDWISTCDELHLSLGNCDVRHRTETNPVWNEVKERIHGYTLDNPKPNTVYEFQVRCSCVTGLPSDWSAINRIRSKETAPVGELDVWRDCGISQASSDCFLTWKKLPTSQACGLILGYEVTLSHNNGTAVLVNMSTAEPRGLLLCDEMQCHSTLSLKDVSSVSVSAYNARGATVPSYLAMPIPGKEKDEQSIHLVMNEEHLNVSWDLPSQLLDNLKEYVLQYKQAGSPPCQGFDWVKVNKSQRTGYFKGNYTKYTPFQVSLFTVSHSSKVHHQSSVIGYSLQGTPPSVPSFKVFSIAATHVYLFWESVPLAKQKGMILYYQVVVDSGVNGQNVYNVSASSQHESETFKLLHLSPGQEYEVRIRAVTAAGPGENATAKFKTKHHEDFALIIAIVVGILFVVVICVLLAFCSASRGENKVCPLVPPFFYDKVPDARNSHIFRHMKHQTNDPWAWICIPIYEPHPKISLLEVVEIQPWAFKSSLEKTTNTDRLTRPVVGDGCLQMDHHDNQREEAVTEECHRTDHRYRREEYSKMVDSDEDREEEEKREDCWSSIEEEQSTFGYEKHFMPTAFELLEV